mgnify:CR=1
MRRTHTWEIEREESDESLNMLQFVCEMMIIMIKEEMIEQFLRRSFRASKIYRNVHENC